MAEAFNDKVLAAANAYLTNNAGTVQPAMDDALVRALASYTGITSSSSLNDLIVKACQQALSSTSSVSVNDLVYLALRTYLTNHFVTNIPIDLNGLIMIAADYYIANGAGVPPSGTAGQPIGLLLALTKAS